MSPAFDKHKIIAAARAVAVFVIAAQASHD